MVTGPSHSFKGSPGTHKARTLVFLLAVPSLGKMSSVLTGGFPSTKSSEAQENRGLRGKRAKGQPTQPNRKSVSENPTNPQKSLTAPVPLVTPRKALGDLSNSTATPAINKGTARKPRQAASTHKQRPGGTKESKVLKSNRAAPVREREGTTAGVKGYSTEFPDVEESFPDIELMPHTGNQDNLDPPFVPPPYFKSLSSVLRYNPIPSSLPSFSVADSLSSLSLDPNVRPSTASSTVTVAGWSSDLPESASPDGLPDIPDLGDL